MPSIPSSSTTTTENKDNLHPYRFHGVDLSTRSDSKEALATCPFCGRDKKFSVQVDTGIYRCLVCAEGTDKGGGNIYTFLRRLHSLSVEGKVASDEDYRQLSIDRRVSVASLKEWGVVKSLINRKWIVPGYGIKGELNQLYQYVRINGRMLLLPTPNCSHQIFAPNGMESLLSVDCNQVYVCEGPWDGIAFWEALKDRENKAVVSVPGCSTFPDKWAQAFNNRAVSLLYDNDHPKTNPTTNKSITPAGYAGMRRVTGTLTGHSRVTHIRYLKWGEEGYNKELPDGYDVRDFLSDKSNGINRAERLEKLVGMLTEVPQEWKVEQEKVHSNESVVSCKPCTTYKELITAWRKALKWTEGLDHALATMLASIMSTRAVGDQLWIKVIGPASCGKSTLCEALAVNTKHTLSKSTIRGFHSGFKASRDDEEDNSLVAQLYNKTLITKDGDTLLQSPNLGQILAEARDLYDCTSRTHYRNKTSKDYQGVRMTWLLCGTSSLRSIDSSELGERFLDCVIMERIDEELEDEILLKKAYQANEDMAIEYNGDASSRYGTDLAEAMSLTGGYIDHLCNNPTSLLNSITFPDENLHKCIKLGKFVAYMRARPSTRQEETSERELAGRLVSQHIRLAKCLAAVLNKSEVDNVVIRRAARVAMDTSRGQSLEMLDYIMKRSREEGADAKALAMFVNMEDVKARIMLRFLKKIGALEHINTQFTGNRLRWRTTQTLNNLYKEVKEISTNG